MAMEMAFIYLTVGLTILCVVPDVDAASFFGNSHIILPFRESSATTQIELRFKTIQPDGLLLLATGDTDFLALMLFGGIIQLRADFGSGELVMNSELITKFNNNKWHQLVLICEQDQIQLNVDGKRITQPTVGRPTHDVQRIFLGGTGGYDNPSNIRFKNFRGCLSNVKYNQYDILSAAQKLNDPNRIYHISWSCDQQFAATTEDPISFTSNNSFVTFPHMHIKTQGWLVMDVKTKASDGLIAFNAGRNASANEIIAIEVINNTAQLTVNRGGDDIILKSKIIISNGGWHQIRTFFYEEVVEFYVDNEKAMGYFAVGLKTSFNLTGHLFIGGLGLHAKHKAHKRKLKSAIGRMKDASSLIGCIKDVKINSRAFGLPEARVSQNIKPYCKWTFPCAENPCNENSKCVEKNNEYKCVCTSGDCDRFIEEAPRQGQVQNTGTSNTDTNDDEEVQLVVIHPLQVTEGSHQTITTDNIRVVFNRRKHNIRESAIQFDVTTPPRHGRINIDLSRRRSSNNVFTLLDIAGDKISYVHDGSESPGQDEVALKMRIVSSRADLPERLTEMYAFILPINIIHQNDQPVVTVINDGLLKIVRNTKICISSKILTLHDPDSKPSDIVYSTVCRDMRHSYFENARNLGYQINTFTHREVIDRNIWFVNVGDNLVVCEIRVVDNSLPAGAITLTIQAVNLQLHMVKNSGDTLIHGSAVLLSENTLLARTNVPNQDLEIRYQITQQPRHGEIQRYQTDTQQWVAVDTFAQRQINQGKMRYVHTDPVKTQAADQFTFIINCLDQRIKQQAFQVRLETISLNIVTTNTLRILKGTYKAITSKEIWVISNNELSSEEIIFTLLRLPTHGHLFRNPGNKPLSEVFHRPLQKGEVFTLEDIERGTILYKLKKTFYERRRDFVDMKVSATDVMPLVTRLHVEYIPEEKDIRFVNNVLYNVTEGGQKTILRSELYLETMDYREFEYIIKDFPKHGVVQIINPRTNTVVKSNITKFTNEDIRKAKLVYKHDDSESDRDFFTFTALPIITQKIRLPMQVQEFSGTFEIRILMRNDNLPQRVVNKMFEVVTNKEKLITLDDLQFTDPDIDFDSMNLMYTIHKSEISNGDIVFSGNRSRASRFTQRDIADRKILFIHNGESYGRGYISVSDGQYSNTGLLEIQASNPKVTITRNFGVLVKRGMTIPITTSNLSVETNVNVEPQNIRFVLTEEPLHGRLTVRGREVTEFSLADLQNGLLKYHHSGRGTEEDLFKYAVVAGGAQVQASFPIRVFVDSQRHPPRVVHNEVLPVVETSTSVITRDYLLVTHPDSLPSTIIYTIRTSGSLGKVYVGNTNNAATSFTQSDVNEGKVRYHHMGRSPGDDSFIFEVSNGQQILRGLEFVIEILPSTLRLLAHNFTIREGARKPLTPAMLRLQGQYYDGRDILYNIIEQPKSGLIENIRARGVRLSSFTSEELRQGSIFYVHDNSEEASDQLKIQARLVEEEKDSDIKTLYILIQTINDQPPYIAVNKGMEVWRNSITVISSDYLKAEDVDSPPESLTFVITQPTNGHVALRNKTYQQITRFSQAMLDAGQVVFVHKGDTRGSFTYSVSDGINGNTDREQFIITAKPLILEVVHNRQLNVYPGRTQVITHDHLFTQTNDPTLSRPIIYNIKFTPRKGRIITMFRGRAVEVTSFKQEDIDEGKIFYEHTNNAHGWSEVDLFFFEVSTLYAESLKEQRFDINISYQNLLQGELSDLIHVNDVTVMEGGKVSIDSDIVDAGDYVDQLQREGRNVRVIYVVQTLPKYAALLMDGKPTQIGATFNQDKIDSGELTYNHDDSETLSDTFKLILYIENLDEVDSQENEDIHLTINVTITPFNDQTYEIITRKPSISVVQTRMAYITSDDLKTIDADTPPNHIIYDIIDPPGNGFISYITESEVTISRFSQKDIDDRLVIFTQSVGSSSSFFRFRVSDGKFSPTMKVFEIHVLPLTLDFVGNKTVWILQGDHEAALDNKAVQVITNGLKDMVKFNVTKETMYGTLYVENMPSTKFNQNQIDNKLVVYRQRDMTVYMDYFMCTVSYPGSDRTLHGQRVTVMVKPLVRQRPLVSPLSGMVPITLLTLDATELANKTGSNPEYKIVSPPKFGKLVYHLRAKREIGVVAPVTQIDRFSHEDIKESKVLFIPDESLSVSSKRDTFTYVLNAKGVQPAKGTLRIRISSNSKISPTGTSGEIVPGADITTTPLDKEGVSKNPRKMEVMSPSVSNDFVIVIAVLIPLCLIIIITAIVVYIVWRKKRQQGDYLPGEQKNQRPVITGPVGLDQPHVHIEPQEPSPVSLEEQHSLVRHHPYYNVPSASAAHPDYDGESHTAYCDSMHHSELSPNEWELHAPLIETHRTEVSSTVPECKVTPLSDNEDGAESCSPEPSSATKSNTSLDLYNWSLSDPEFLQHCRTSNPVLRDNQYWV